MGDAAGASAPVAKGAQGKASILDVCRFTCGHLAHFRQVRESAGASLTSITETHGVRWDTVCRIQATGLECRENQGAEFMFLNDQIEVLSPNLPRGRFRSVLFDFDGTLSLIREGWPQVMIPMMVDELRRTDAPETEAELSTAVEEFVMRLNGRQTIYQMIQLAEEVKRRGGQPLDPLQYKHRYHDLLMERIQGRLDALRQGRRHRRNGRCPAAMPCWTTSAGAA